MCEHLNGGWELICDVMPTHYFSNHHFMKLTTHSMVQIYMGYIIEQDELVCFLNVQGCGPEPDEAEFTVDDAWINFVSW